jgi:endonuclease IV
VNDFHKEVPEEKTIEQAARALNEVGRHAAGLGQTVRLENHGSAGRLVTLRKILDQVTQPNVRIKLNCDVRDNEGGAFAQNFALVKDRLDDTLHFHELSDAKFPFQLQTDLLVDMGWNGWWLGELSSNPPDRVQALIGQRELWEKLIARSLARA